MYKILLDEAVDNQTGKSINPIYKNIHNRLIGKTYNKETKLTEYKPDSEWSMKYDEDYHIK